MSGPAESPDVVIIGGGPAGSVSATLLADAGHEVVVLERERFPRYHIGESLLSATMPILDLIGALPKIEAHGFLKKPGGTFQWGRQKDPWSFFFREDPGGRPHGFQVIRSEFDKILLDNAREHGAAVFEEHTVTRVDTSMPTPTIWGRRSDGHEFRLTPRFLIDASGQQAVIGSSQNNRVYNEFFKNLAIWGYFTNAERLPGELANHIFSCAFNDGWFWYIPLHDGTMSVGAVVDVKRWRQLAQEDPEGTFRGFIARCEPIASKLKDATLVSPVRIIRDYSYKARQFAGPGWLLAGDAAAFIDPVFSTGVHLACLAGFLGARTVTRLLSGTEDNAALLADYQQHYSDSFERYVRFLMFFYDHNVDADSYFWSARRILTHAADDLDQRSAFVRLISGGGDRQELPALDVLIAREHERWAHAIEAGRAGALPGVDLLRVQLTRKLLNEA